MKSVVYQYLFISLTMFFYYATYQIFNDLGIFIVNRYPDYCFLFRHIFKIFEDFLFINYSFGVKS
jgi:hypothetical protein